LPPWTRLLPVYPGQYTPNPPPCVDVRAVNPVGLTNNHTPPPRLTLSFRHIRALPQRPCAKLSRPCRRGRTTSKLARLSRRASTPSLAQPDSMPGPVGVCDCLSNYVLPCLFNPSHVFSSVIRRPFFRRVDCAYMPWPSASLQQSREQHMHLRGRRGIRLCNRRFRMQVTAVPLLSLTDCTEISGTP